MRQSFEWLAAAADGIQGIDTLKIDAERILSRTLKLSPATH